MNESGRIVCGGGWKKRQDYFIKVWAICSLVAIIPATIPAARFHESFGAWGLILPAVLLVISLILFRFERPKLIWGPPDAKMLDLDQPVFASKNPPTDIPKYDPHNLY